MGINEEKLGRFSEDKYNRKVIAENLTKIISSEESSMVISLDSEWGTGKTTFITMWKDMLDNDVEYKERFQTLYFNAWSNDYLKDPLVAIYSEMNKQIIEKDSSMKTLGDKLKPIFKTSLVFGAKMLSRGILDIESINLGEYTENQLTDLAGKIGELSLKELEVTKNVRNEFKIALSEYQKDINKKIIFFIDELDRCRPTFAVELLEIMKHLFSIDNVIFVVSTDKEQLSHAIATIYGQGMDTVGYLRRFFDLDYKLPMIPINTYIENKYNCIFEGKFNIKVFKIFLKEMMLEENFSLRDIDKTYYYVKLLIPLIKEFNEDKRYTEIYIATISYLYSTLIIAKVKKPVIYKKIMEGDYEVMEIVSAFKSINLNKYSDNAFEINGWHNEALENLISPIFGMFLKLNLEFTKGENMIYIPNEDFLVGIRNESGQLEDFSRNNTFSLKQLFYLGSNDIINRLNFLEGFTE